jgi:hypothetical protein
LFARSDEILDASVLRFEWSRWRKNKEMKRVVFESIESKQWCKFLSNDSNCDEN